MGVAKGLKVPCLFMITEYTLSKKPGGWYTPYTRVYPPPQYTTALAPCALSPVIKVGGDVMVWRWTGHASQTSRDYSGTHV